MERFASDRDSRRRGGPRGAHWGVELFFEKR
jgi:hypothetical protein